MSEISIIHKVISFFIGVETYFIIKHFIYKNEKRRSN